ncbi:unnamed protein product [Discula destructiva]
MQFSKILSAAAVAVPFVSAAAVELAQRNEDSISYADAYLNIELAIKDYGCGTATNNFFKDYTKFVDVLADYTSIIATPDAANDKGQCGQCVAVSYTNAAGKKRTVYAVTVDSTAGFYNLDKAGFAGLDGYGSFAAGTLKGDAVPVDIKHCRRAN